MIIRQLMFDRLLDADPTFRPVWQAFVAEWQDEPELPQYIAVTISRVT